MNVKTIPPTLPVSPKPAGSSDRDSSFLSVHLDFNDSSRDVRRMVMFLFRNKGTFYSEAEIREESGYIPCQEKFISDIAAFEAQLDRTLNAPLRLMKKEVGQGNYVYAIVSREFFLSAQQAQVADREIDHTTDDTRQAVQQTTL